MSIKSRIKKAWGKTKILLSIPTFWVSFFILVFAVMSIIASKIFTDFGDSFTASVFSNIFAGLITGFAISILGGTKAAYCAHMEFRLSWLDETHKMILDFLTLHGNLYKNREMSDEEFANAAYDVGAHANWVNDRIIHYTDFNKENWFNPREYFMKRYGYDWMKTGEVLADFKETLYDVGIDSSKRKEEIESFRPIIKIMTNLNHSILKDMDVIKIKLASSRKSIV